MFGPNNIKNIIILYGIIGPNYMKSKVKPELLMDKPGVRKPD